MPKSKRTSAAAALPCLPPKVRTTVTVSVVIGGFGKWTNAWMMDALIISSDHTKNTVFFIILQQLQHTE